MTAVAGLVAQVQAARAEAVRRASLAVAVGQDPAPADLAVLDGEALAAVEREADRLRELRRALPEALRHDEGARALAAAVAAYDGARASAAEVERSAGLAAVTGAEVSRRVIAARGEVAPALAAVRAAEAALAGPEAALRRVLRLVSAEERARYDAATVAAERAASRLRAAERALAPLEDVGALDRIKAGLAAAARAAWSAFADGDDASKRAAEREQARLRGEVEAREAPSFSEKIAAARSEVEQARAEVEATRGGPAAVLRDLAVSVGLEVPGEAPAANLKKKRRN